ncbi:MAG: hypothetical protein KDA22_10055, partial [Phycisphaerales bacterium]|nr:hypothetical protein [Phycisphaerales bacterium]
MVNRRSWRVLAGIYALALTTGTHWPKLQLGGEETPPFDKLAHAGAFGVLTLLLWRTGWFRSLPALFATAVLWCLVDEVSQAMPGLGRETSFADFFASSTGVVMALAVLWAFRPVGGWPSRIQYDRTNWAIERTLVRPASALLIAAATIAFGAIGAVAAAGIAMLFPNPMPVLLGLLGLGIGMAVGVQASIEILRRRELARLDEPICFRCGAAAGAVEFDERGNGACLQCGAALHAGQWLDPPAIRRPVLRRLLGISALAGGGIIVAGFALYLAVLALRPMSRFFLRLNEAYNALPDDARLVFDLAWVV